MTKEELWGKQNEALRHPTEIFGTSLSQAGITKNTLKHTASAGFTQLLHRMGITLIASREYENMLIALRATSKTKLEQSFFHLPHPSGIAIDHNANKMYVAATRNPNQIVEFSLSSGHLTRLKIGKPAPKMLMPSRSKYYPGEYYFHDLAFCGGQLYANSVGMNCIIPVDITKPEPEKPLWWPKCIEKSAVPNHKANYIQLNSIAAGDCLENSFFSASGAKISSRRPGHMNYPVDQMGVIFSGASREPMGHGLTRPHSARVYKDQVWVANSGYGQVGYIDGKDFKPVFTFNGWTRGLCFIGDVLFVGVSRVLPRFRHYAPGIKTTKHTCAIVAVDLKKGKVIGDIKFPYGNQLFAIEHLPAADCAGFPFKSVTAGVSEKKIFSVSLV